MDERFPHFSSKTALIYLCFPHLCSFCKRHSPLSGDISRRVLSSDRSISSTLPRAEVGKQYIFPHYTSQDCSACGTLVKKTLSVRTHVCTGCGVVLDRDHNAAMNILQKALSTVGHTGTDAPLSA